MVTLSVQNGTIICPVYYLGLGDDAAILVMLLPTIQDFTNCPTVPGALLLFLL